METMEKLGLQGDWRKVVESLKAIADIYDRVNRVISLNTDLRLRYEGLSGFLGEGERVLDLGCGNGVFTRVALSLQPNLGDVIMVDILEEMLLQIEPNSLTHPVQGIFENLPFRDSCINTVIMGFSLRDSYNLEKAVAEVNRVSVGGGGKLAVVDLGKPDSRLLSGLLSLYWRVAAPLIAFIMLGRRGLEVSKIYTTYKRHPRTGRLLTILRQYFRDVVVREKMLGGVALVQAQYPMQNIKISMKNQMIS